MKTQKYSNYKVFIQSVAEAELNEEVGQHELLQDFNFGVERKHVAYVGFAELHYNVFDKAPFHAWVDVTEDYIVDFERELETTIERLRDAADEDPRDCIGYNKEEYLNI